MIACVSAIGVICHDNPHLSLHQPHALSSPPLLTMARGEPAGTVAADIYAFGKMLFVISTGRHPVNDWPLPTETLLQGKEWSGLEGLNKIFCKACRPLSGSGLTETEQRYATAVEMLADLRKAQKELGDHPTEKM